jgi:hypothetical protein
VRSALAMRVRSEWRRRWPWLVALTLLVGLVGATVMTAIAGARRSTSTVPRFLDFSETPDVLALFGDESFTGSRALLRLPEVEEGERVAAFLMFPERGYIGWGASVDGKIPYEFARSRVIRGRIPPPESPDEVALPEPVASLLHVDVGDVFRLYAPSGSQLDCMLTEGGEQVPGCEFLERAFDGENVNVEVLDGPELQLRVVGITRSPLDVAGRPRDVTFAFLPPGFYDRWHDLMAYRAGVALRYRPDVDDAAFEAAAERAVPADRIADFANVTRGREELQSTVDVLGTGLLAFAAAAGLVGAVAIAQALAHQAQFGVGERVVLRALGGSRLLVLLDAFIVLVPVAIVGALLAVGGAILASNWMPIAFARRVEPNPGVDVDWVVVAAGAFTTIILTFLLAGLAAFVAAQRARRAAANPRRRISVPIVGTSRPPAWLGLRFATDPGRGRTPVPVRSALLGVVVGVGGVVAVGAFGAALDRLDDEPQRYGIDWDATFGLADSPELASARADAMAADPDVTGLAQAWIGLRARVEGVSYSSVAFDSRKGGLTPAVVSGRVPRGADEVALGGRTLRRIGAHVGDHVTVETRQMRVVGQALFPPTADAYPMADGALMTFDAVESLHLLENSDAASPAALVRIAPDADRNAVFARLQRVSHSPPEPNVRPAEVDRLQQLESLPNLLGLFLLLVGLLAVGHALIATVRQRRAELAVLRALGLTAGQTRRTVSWEASTICVVGTIIGIPLGLLAGRIAWGVVARAYGLADDMAVPTLVLALALPVGVLLGNVVAWWPSRRAARLSPAVILRSE